MFISKLYQKMSSISCKLCCVKNSHEPINLPHLEAVTVGRSRITKIKNTGLSRNQVKLTANLEKNIVQVTALGLNPSGVNGCSIKQNQEYILKHKDRLELLLDQYIYEIIFDPNPDKIEEKETDNVKNEKRKSEDFNENKKKQRKIEVVPQKNDVWEEIDNKNLYIFTSQGVISREKIAAYDIDGTIIATKSGARFPKDSSDWKFAFPVVPRKLQELHEKEYKIVFFTNQAGVSSGKTKIADLKNKFQNVVKEIKVPVQIFIAPTRTVYRKPAPGMWDALIKKNVSTINIEESFYVGDAAGRQANWAPKKKKDHSMADRLFALNLQLSFHTPEEHFLGAKKVAYAMPEFDPTIDFSKMHLFEPEDSSLNSKKQEVIIMVGSPGSGKSTICKTHLVPAGYIHINRDTLGSWQKCLAEMERQLKLKNSVVIDNTNPDLESRKRFIDAATKLGIPVRCFNMSTSLGQAKHNNFFREITDKSHQQITEIIINSYKKNFVEPNVKEGFEEVLKVNCIPRFDDEELKRLYHMYLLEK